MRNNAITYVLIGAALLCCACKDEEKKETTIAPPVKVKVVRVANSEITGSRKYSGTVEASEGLVASFSAAGTIQSMNVSAGDRVSKGQVIATLDAGSLRNAHEIAKATLAQAQDAHDRMKMLHDANSLPDMQWVEIQNALKQAQSAEEIARRAVDDAVLRAPVSGYVSEKLADAGMTVAPIQPIVRIVNINPVKVNISLPEQEIASVSAGAEADINVRAIGRKCRGKVTERGVAANPLTRAYDVKIKVDNTDGSLLPGMICDVTLDTGEAVNACVLPVQSVLLDSDNNNFVWLCKDGMAIKRLVVTSGFADRGIIVTGGIVEGDSVIVAGQQKVSSGTALAAI